MTMIHKSLDGDKKIVVDCAGPSGNAFAILGLIQRLSKQLGGTVKGRDIEDIIEEMESGDYLNLVQTADNYFGEFVDFYSVPKE